MGRELDLMTSTAKALGVGRAQDHRYSATEARALGRRPAHGGKTVMNRIGVFTEDASRELSYLLSVMGGGSKKTRICNLKEGPHQQAAMPVLKVRLYNIRAVRMSSSLSNSPQQSDQPGSEAHLSSR